MPIVPAGYLPSDTASHLVGARAMGGMAALYTLDICSGISGVYGPLSECMASGVVKEPADFFDDFFVVRYFWSGFGGGGYAVGGRMLHCGTDKSHGRQLAKWLEATGFTVRCEICTGELQ
jgi:hypothetical protein